MNVTDPVADLLTRIRNAIVARHAVVKVPHSKFKLELARVLKEEGYVRNFKVVDEAPRKTMKILLKYDDRGGSVINGMKRISSPGCRVYANRTDLPSVYGGLGIAILSTSRGVMTGHHAKEAGVGGEILCHVW